MTGMVMVMVVRIVTRTVSRMVTKVVTRTVNIRRFQDGIPQEVDPFSSFKLECLLPHRREPKIFLFLPCTKQRVAKYSGNSGGA